MSRTWWFVVGLLASACNSNRHQIVLSIDTTAAIPCDLDGIQVIANAGTSHESHIKKELSSLPMTLTLEDDASMNDFELDVYGLKGGSRVLHAHGHPSFGDSDAKLTTNIVLDDGCLMQQPCEVAPPVENPEVVARPPRSECVSQYGESSGIEVFTDACTAGDSPRSGQVTFVANGRPAPVVELTALAPILAESQLRFYGRLVRHVWVHKNGYVAFGGENPDPNNALYPGRLDRAFTNVGAAPPAPAAMPFWDTLNLGTTGGVCFALAGETPNQTLRVTWSKVCVTDPCLDSSLNFTVSLNEQNEQVSFAYGDMRPETSDRANGATATVGLVKDDTQRCTAGECILETGVCAKTEVPCGFSQVQSGEVRKLQNVTFTPVGPK
ncbi:MAG TPA: hypothetical protein VFT22_15555 [Kofleriaceae bacterium]|nr:hypothetical protein [Kofleriaceae bacterium]